MKRYLFISILSVFTTIAFSVVNKIQAQDTSCIDRNLGIVYLYDYRGKQDYLAHAVYLGDGLVLTTSRFLSCNAFLSIYSVSVEVQNKKFDSISLVYADDNVSVLRISYSSKGILGCSVNSSWSKNDTLDILSKTDYKKVSIVVDSIVEVSNVSGTYPLRELYTHSQRLELIGTYTKISPLFDMHSSICGIIISQYSSNDSSLQYLAVEDVYKLLQNISTTDVLVEYEKAGSRDSKRANKENFQSILFGVFYYLSMFLYYSLIPMTIIGIIVFFILKHRRKNRKT